MIRGGAILLLLLMTFLSGVTQEYLPNPSFEGSIGQAGTPPDWDSCYTASTPNVQPVYMEYIILLQMGKPTLDY